MGSVELRVAPFDPSRQQSSSPEKTLRVSSSEQSAILPDDLEKTVSKPFDVVIERLRKMRQSLASPNSAHIGVDEVHSSPPSPQDQDTTPTPTFEEAFAPFTRLFEIVFYRRYPEHVRDDAKQEALLALYKKWKTNPELFDERASYVVTAAIFGISNWRKEETIRRVPELRLRVDDHDKVIGASRAQRETLRWVERADTRIDVDRAVEAALAPFPINPERSWAQEEVLYLKLGKARTKLPVSRPEKRRIRYCREVVQTTLKTELVLYQHDERGLSYREHRREALAQNGAIYEAPPARPDTQDEPSPNTANCEYPC